MHPTSFVAKAAMLTRARALVKIALFAIEYCRFQKIGAKVREEFAGVWKCGGMPSWALVKLSHFFEFSVFQQNAISEFSKIKL